MQTEIRKRIFQRGKPIGALVGIKCGDRVQLGWSKCAKCDSFVRKRAFQIAWDRAQHGVSPDKKLPFVVALELDAFRERCAKYFKVSISQVMHHYSRDPDGTTYFDIVGEQ